MKRIFFIHVFLKNGVSSCCRSSTRRLKCSSWRCGGYSSTRPKLKRSDWSNRQKHKPLNQSRQATPPPSCITSPSVAVCHPPPPLLTGLHRCSLCSSLTPAQASGRSASLCIYSRSRPASGGTTLKKLPPPGPPPPGVQLLQTVYKIHKLVFFFLFFLIIIVRYETFRWTWSRSTQSCGEDVIILQGYLFRA